MNKFKDELINCNIKWTDSGVHTFTMEEILGEDGVTAMKVALMGYKVVKGGR